ncbi:MAG: hypothetical protein KBT27_03055 [Prevotellaceae bacterium]|nr:hypothetical protein [Candidatus Faecinaster equi]
MSALIFSNEQNVAQLKGIRVCLAGSFSIPMQTLGKQLRSLGVTYDHATAKNDTTLPVKESTNLFVVGNDAPIGCLARYEMNCHDGFKALKITEQELYALMRGEIFLDIPKTIVKHIDLDYDSYYCWQSPSNLRQQKSSPYRYDMNSVHSPVYGRELYVPRIEGINYYSLIQIIGNLGGFSNDQNLPNSDMILLSDETIEKWKRGEKDAVIQGIEDKYNSGDTKIFDCCFTCLSDFLKWVEFRLSKCPDTSTIELMNKLYINK